MPEQGKRSPRIDVVIIICVILIVASVIILVYSRR
jgi:hypothetical protein